MRALHRSRYFPDLKALRIAVAAGALAGLTVLGACADGSQAVGAKVVGPKGPAAELGVVGTFAGEVEICIDPSSAHGSYTFTSTVLEGTFMGTLNGGGPADDAFHPTVVFNWQGSGVPCVVNFTRLDGGIQLNHIMKFSIGISGPAGTVYDKSECIRDDDTLGWNCTSHIVDPTHTGNTTNNPVETSAQYYHGSQITAFFHVPILVTCVLGYPFTSGVARTSTTFNESSVLAAFGLGNTTPFGSVSNNELRVWTTDEHALTLGVNKVSVKTSGGTAVTNYSFSAMPTGNPANVGDLLQLVSDGPQRATDGFERPLFPALFITNITGLTDNATNTSAAIRVGDWQFGGIGVPPTAIFGSWKAAAIFVDQTKIPNLRTMTPGVDPAKNHFNGLDTAPPVGTQDLGYGAEVVWDINTLQYGGLPLVSGNTYRLQFMVHDGDQNKTGGDVGQACVNYTK